jgi:DNA-directed RNA polymerase specialized sigma subunit
MQAYKGLNQESGEDIDAMVHWQKTKDPKEFANLVMRYQPVVNQVVNKYKTVGVSPATLKAQATVQMIKAFESYDPNKGAAPTTHIWNSLQKVQRIASESLSSGHIPEHRNLKRATFMTVRENLKDRLGYDPSVADMADELNWDVNEVSRMNSESFNEITSSSLDFYSSPLVAANKDKELVDYMYNSLSGQDKVIFEHTFGFGGKPILNNKQIAQKLNVNEMAVHRAKKKLSQQIKDYR